MFFRPPKASYRAITALALAGIALICAPAAASAAPAFYDGNSADGSVAVFSTKDQMVPGDTDQQLDVYVRSFDSSLAEYVTHEVSLGPRGGNDALPAQYVGMSSDGNEIFFSTRESLVPGDTDSSGDIYMRVLSENRTVLVSQGGDCAGQGCGNGEVEADALPGGISGDGNVVFFGTDERLSSTDTDSAFDIYARDLVSQTTTLVTAPDPSCAVCASEGLDSQFRGTDEAGDRAFYTTAEQLAEADTDGGQEDIYQRDLDAETTSLVSVEGICPPSLPVGQSCEPSYGGASADGSHVFFETNERVDAGDTDSSQDVYDWSGGATAALVSTGSTGGNGGANAIYAGASPDGTTAYFETDEALIAGDADSAQDVYGRAGGVTTLVSAGESGKGNLAVPASFDWASTSGTPAVAFATTEKMTAADTDNGQDVYLRSGGVTTLVSTGPEGTGEAAAVFAGASNDGARIFFVTSEALVPADTDSSSDIYLRSAGETTLVSVGQVGGNGAFPAGLRGVSSDGSRVFFTTQERLTVDDDFAGESDVYSWSGSGTLLVSVKNSPDLVLGPPPPTLEGTSPASPGSTLTPAVFGQAISGSLIKVYTTFDCSGKPVAQGTAAELAAPGLTVTEPVAAGSTTTWRATAEAEGVVSPCSAGVSYKQEEAPPPPPPPGEGEEGGGGGSGSSGGSQSGGKQGGLSYVAPQVKITFGPLAKTRLRRPVFRFVDSTGQPGTKFFCRVDKKRWSACTSPTKVKKLTPGRHVFGVKAVNAVGAPAAGAVRHAFKVVLG
jgi:hypothetical protein